MVQPTDDELQLLTAQILAGMQEWRVQHPKATFRQIETEVDARLAQLRARMLQQAAQSSSATDWQQQPPQEQPHCPDCQQPLTRRGLRSRRLRSHHDEALTLHRHYGTCPQCGRGFFPPR